MSTLWFILFTALVSTEAFCPQVKLGWSSKLFVSTDMNIYNLASMDEILSEWTAVIRPKSALEDEGVYLAAKSKENFCDSLHFAVRRNGGLGLFLTEIAGGRDDGLGITVVEEIGGNSKGSGILPGDSIVSLHVSQPVAALGSDGVMETEVVQTYVSTECLGFDRTIEAIRSLPEPKSNDEMVSITVKRLRRKPKVKVNIQYPPGQRDDDICIELFAGENLRRGMLVRGIKLNDPLARRFDSGGTGDCGAEGTCATCTVNVIKGADLLSPLKEQEKQILANKPKWRMACRTVVGHGMKQGELTVQVSPRQW